MGHYYTQTGEPCYYVPKAKSSDLRDTTIRDAKKLSLVPSVTEILKVADKPGLNNWLIDQHILAALTMPRDEDWDSATLLKKVKQDANEQSRTARELGSEIHNAIEDHFKNKPVTPKYHTIYEAINEVLNDEFGPQGWISEKTFSHPLGYGGKSDLHCDIAVIDFKTTDKPLDGLKCYDEHLMQGAAYKHGHGLSDAVTGNIFVSTRNIGEVRLILHGDTSRHWEMFKSLLNYWKLAKDYDSGYQPA